MYVFDARICPRAARASNNGIGQVRACPFNRPRASGTCRQNNLLMLAAHAGTGSARCHPYHAPYAVPLSKCAYYYYYVVIVLHIVSCKCILMHPYCLHLLKLLVNTYRVQWD